MADWKEMAKRLRKNQGENLKNYPKQASQAERRVNFLKEIEDEKATVLSNTRRKRNIETPTSQKRFEK